MTKSTIDLTDRKILGMLDQNARLPFSQIAKALRVSKATVSYRFAKLKERGIIKGSFAEINTVAAGYFTFRILFKLSQCDTTQLNKLQTQVLGNAAVIWYTSVLGPWDIDLLYATKSVADFEAFRQELFVQNNSIIEDYHISLLSDIYSYQKSFLLNEKSKMRPFKHFAPTDCIVDGADERILRMLSANAMMPITELAQKVFLSINTVKDRMRKMERGGIILNYRLYLDTNLLGYEYFKLHVRLRNYTPAEFQELFSYLGAKPEVVYIDRYINGDDLELEVQLEDERKFAQFLQEILFLYGRIIKSHALMKFYNEKIFRFLPEK